MNLFYWDDLAFQNVTHEQVVVHGLRNDLRNRERVELNEGVMFRSASLNGIASKNRVIPVEDGPAYFFVSRQAETGDLAELGEVGLELVLVETMRDAREVQHPTLVGLTGD
jgi:hypothetical protein